MKSLILTSLYLAKDTLNRWRTRISSPLARLMVVFFLTVCSLCFMANYVLSAKLIQDKIQQNGGDLMSISEFVRRDSLPKLPKDPRQLSAMFDTDILVLKEPGLSSKVNDEFYNVAIYDDMQLPEFLPLLADDLSPTLVFPRGAGIQEGPNRMNISDFQFPIYCKALPPNHMLASAYPRGIILISSLLAEQHKNYGFSLRMLMKVKKMEYKSIRQIEDYFNTLGKLESAPFTIISNGQLLKEMGLIMSNQMECRAGFSIGIGVIVGILLTALASMEYRQNEYIYTLMKSFGISPALLIGAFIVENLILVAAAFCASVYFFMLSQHIVLKEFFKLGNTVLTLKDIEPDLILLAAALALSVFISAIPIAAAAQREIGRVLK